MRVLVTGATGRVGANLVKQLAERDIPATAMVMPNDQLVRKLEVFSNLKIVRADLRDQESVNAACDGPTHIVHLAAQLVRGRSPVDEFYDINSFGTLRLLEGSIRSGTVQRFVLASTDGTYRPGDPIDRPLTEDSLQEPADYYGTSKLLGEVILRNHAIQHGIPFSIVRFATVISPEESVNMFRVPFWRKFLGWQSLGKDSHLWPLFSGQPDLMEIYSNATSGIPDEAAIGFVGPDKSSWSLSLVDVRDAVEGVYRALTEPQALGRAFNIAAAKPTYHVEAVSAISETFKVPQMMIEMPMNHHLELAIDAARIHLNYEPRHNFCSTLETATYNRIGDYIEALSDTGVGSVLS